MIKLIVTVPLLSVWLFGGSFIEKESRYGVDKCALKLQKRIKAMKGFSLFILVDHTKNAKRVGLKMPKSKLLIFANPKAGTMLMNANPMMAYELPLKILVSEKEGKTLLSYRDPNWLADTYGLQDSPVIPKMKKAMQELAAVCR